MSWFRKGGSEVKQAIQDYLELIAEDATREDGRLLELLIERGHERGLAWQVMGLIPCLASREKLAGLGVRFSDDFVEYDPSGEEVRSGKLKKHPVWAAALGLRKTIMDCPAIDRMVMRSAEFTAINDALKSGSEPENLQTSPITMVVAG